MPINAVDPVGFANVNPFAILDDIARDAPIRKAPKKKEKDLKEIYKVRDYLGVHSVAGDFGIEVEVEGSNLYNTRGGDAYWLTKKDGSLRDGVEYVLHVPLSLDKTKEAIISLVKSLENSKLIFSFRTSIHVHVNVLEMSRDNLLSFLYLSHLLEDSLVKYSGESREGNRFCLRMKDAEWKIEALKMFFKTEGVRQFPSNDMKYSAINLASLHLFGSIEFRSMRGTLDTEVLFPWLDVLYRIRDFAIHNSVKEIDEAIRLTPAGVAKEVFGEHFELFNYPELEKDIKEAHCRLIELPYIKGG